MIQVTRPARMLGFTLIELVMVIVILGILSAFALPRFADFAGDARQSSIDGARGGVRSASAIAHAACLAASTCANSGNSTVTIEGDSIDMVNGYPDRDEIEVLGSLDGYTLTTTTIATIDSLIIAIDATSGALCFTYQQANGTNAAVISAQGTFNTTTTVCDP